MSCCQCQAIENIFDQEWAEYELERYRRYGASQRTRALIEALKEAGVAGQTLLDIGGGIGTIQHELFKLGIRESLDVDGSSAYLGVAKKEAARQGYSDQAHYLHGDFVQLAPHIPPADIVTLDRVVCCYPDMHALVGLSSARAGRLYGLVFPQDWWWLRLGISLFNLTYRLRRNHFRMFAHRTKAVDAMVEVNGLALRFQRRVGLLWQVRVYARS